MTNPKSHGTASWGRVLHLPRFPLTGWPGLVLLMASLLVSGCNNGDASPAPVGGSGGGGWGGVFADRIIAYTPVIAPGVTASDWPYFFQPQAVKGPPGGTFSVASLGYNPDPLAPATMGGNIIVGLGTGGASSTRACAIDGAGDDLAIYENPFPHTDGGFSGTNNEVAEVAVSEDNVIWHTFPPAIASPCDNLVLSSCYTNLAGVTPTAQGGDRFDLADVIAAAALPAGFQACYVRITDGGTVWEDYGNTQSDLMASGADIDAVRALNHVTVPTLTP